MPDKNLTPVIDEDISAIIKLSPIQFNGIIYPIASRYFQFHDINDCIQEFIIKIHQQIGKGKMQGFQSKTKGDIIRVIYRRMVNHCIDFQRKKKTITKRISSSELSIEVKSFIACTDNINEKMAILIAEYKQKIAQDINLTSAQVFELIVKGYKNPEIAEKMNLKSNYVGRIRYTIKEYFKKCVIL